MIALTRQEIFDAALFGIRQQGYVRSHADYSCRYNGPNGTHCAVGWALDEADVHVSSAQNGEYLGDLVIHNSAARRALGVMMDETSADEQVAFLEALQSIHDNQLEKFGARSVSNFETYMLAFAQRHGLNYTPVVA